MSLQQVLLRSDGSVLSELVRALVIGHDVRKRNRGHRARTRAAVIRDVIVVSADGLALHRQGRLQVGVDVLVKVRLLDDFLAWPDASVAVIR